VILFLSMSSRAKDCAIALERGTGHQTCLASTTPQALAKLEGAEFEAMVIDQAMLESDPRATDTLLNHSGVALPVYVNLALYGTERLVREVQVALRRAESERALARRSAKDQLSHQLRSQLTGILLNSELALQQTSIPPEVASRIRSVHELAQKMTAQLGIA